MNSSFEVCQSDSKVRLLWQNNLPTSMNMPRIKSCNIPNSRESRNPDLVDTLNLFKNILDVKLGDLRSELIQAQDSLKKKIKSDVSTKFNTHLMKKFLKCCTSCTNNFLLILHNN